MGTIYKIENTVNGKCYFGQTINKPEKRKNDHFTRLKKGNHGNKHLQYSWNKHGETAFTFAIISDSEADSQLDGLEKQLIEIFQTMNPKFGYNKESGGNSNKKISPESIEKNRQSRLRYFANGGEAPNKGVPHSKESIEKMKQNRKGKSSNTGIPHSKETKAKISEAKRNRTTSATMTSIIGPDGFICPSISIAASLYKCDRHRLSTAIKNNKPYKGMSFSYLT
jgi:group I intron endonuclease